MLVECSYPRGSNKINILFKSCGFDNYSHIMYKQINENGINCIINDSFMIRICTTYSINQTRITQYMRYIQKQRNRVKLIRRNKRSFKKKQLQIKSQKLRVQFKIYNTFYLQNQIFEYQFLFEGKKNNIYAFHRSVDKQMNEKQMEEKLKIIMKQSIFRYELKSLFPIYSRSDKLKKIRFAKVANYQHLKAINLISNMPCKEHNQRENMKKCQKCLLTKSMFINDQYYGQYCKNKTIKLIRIHLALFIKNMHQRVIAIDYLIICIIFHYLFTVAKLRHYLKIYPIQYIQFIHIHIQHLQFYGISSLATNPSLYTFLIDLMHFKIFLFDHIHDYTVGFRKLHTKIKIVLEGNFFLFPSASRQTQLTQNYFPSS